MRRLATLALVLALVTPAVAQRPAHPYIRPDLIAHASAEATASQPVSIPGGATPGVSSQTDGWLAAKIAGMVGLFLASYADYQESQDAINERRAREGNAFVRSQNGFVNGKRKAALTAGYEAVSWWLFTHGRRRWALIADVVGTIMYGGLAIRAHQIGR